MLVYKLHYRAAVNLVLLRHCSFDAVTILTCLHTPNIRFLSVTCVTWCHFFTAVASEEKERYRNSRQGSRSRRRLLSSDSFRGEASGKGSSKGGKLASEDGEWRAAW
jgi:hypothetical protein